MEKQEWVTDVSSSEESSDEEDIVTIALTNEEPLLPPPPMCIIAKGNIKVCEEDSDSDSDDELDLLMNLLTSSMSIHPSSRGKRARSSFLRALMPS